MPQSTLKPIDFTQHDAVTTILEQLQARFGSEYEKLEVSDTLDEYGHQYVNLVQKGGGVLGIALVGYTYVLEMVGIRFLKLAGTSAGAINTALLAAIDYPADSHHLPKQAKDTKSFIVLDYLCKLQLFDLVDGHPIARGLIRRLTTSTQSKAKVKRYALAIALAVVALFGLDVLLLGLRHYGAWAEAMAQLFFVLSGFVLTAIGGMVFYGLHLLDRFKSRGYGINPGNYFYQWIEQMFEENGISNTKQLQHKVARPVPGLRLRRPHPLGLENLTGDVTFIASEIVSKNKIEFPKMCGLFSSEPNALHPARFVRASMAIPLFFESHLIPGIDLNNLAVQDAWKHFFRVEPECIPPMARLVDGGVLSNFPINVFYNREIEVPRLPVFGIDLDDSPLPAGAKGTAVSDVSTWRLGAYLKHLLDTLRGYYDKDFLLKNDMFQRGIGKILLPDFNWLNFGLTDEEKMKLFVRGAQAAQQFLEKFDWSTYLAARADLYQHLAKTESPTPKA